jgi:signal transduction histidine kinase
MFSPFYTSKANGTGLGLPICKKLVDAHDGNIEVNSDAASGAEFLVSFPSGASREGVIS